MMDRVLAILCALSLFISQAFAQAIPFPGPGARDYGIKAPVAIGSGSASSGTTITFTTTADTPAGSLVIISVSAIKSSSISVSSISDGTNSYSLARSSTWSSDTFVVEEIWYKENAAAVSSGATVTVTTSGTMSNGDSVASGVYIVNAAKSSALDKVNSANAGAGCALPLPASGTTGTLAQANEIAIAAIGGYGTAGVTPVVTESSGFTSAANIVVNTRYHNHISYQIVSATTALNNNPTISVSLVYCGGNVIATFKGL